MQPEVRTWPCIMPPSGQNLVGKPEASILPIGQWATIASVGGRGRSGAHFNLPEYNSSGMGSYGMSRTQIQSFLKPIDEELILDDSIYSFNSVLRGAPA